MYVLAKAEGRAAVRFLFLAYWFSRGNKTWGRDNAGYYPAR